MKREHVSYPRHPLTGRQFQISAHTPRELAAYLHHVDDLRTRLRLGMISPEDVDRSLRRLRHGPVTFEKAALSYARRVDLAPNTRRRVASVLAGPLRPLAAVELDALSPERVAPVFEALSRSMAHASLATVWRTMGAVMRHAAERGYIARVPWGPWRPRAGAGKEGRGLRDCARTPDERARLIDAARALDEIGPYRALGPMVATASMLGLRQGELAGLRWYDVYQGRGIVAIRRQWDGQPLKAGESAELEAPPELFVILNEHRARLFAVEVNAPIFPRPTGGHHTRGSCLSIPEFRAVVERAGFDVPSRWTVHSLRDSFATIEHARSPGDLRRVQERTRHKDLGSLFRYLRSLQRSGGGLAAPAATAMLPARAADGA